MVLHKHVDPQELEMRLLGGSKKKKNLLGQNVAANDYRPLRRNISHQGLAPELTDIYVSKYASRVLIPKYAIPEKGIKPDSAYQLVHDELSLDGNPHLNLASFVNTYVSPEAEKLALESLVKNLADNDEYPAMLDIHQRCVSIIAHLWHAPSSLSAIGTATTGSSEAIMLGGLAMKRRWEAKRKAAGLAYDKPNIIMASCVQVALEKFARYFDVECRLVPISKESNHCLDLTKVEDLIDENTIGIFAIMGTTYTGHYEPVKELSNLLDEVEKKTGFDIPIHVDGASGGFVAPFCHPDLEWDFRVSRVLSINTSGHKFGLTAAGCGWIIWRDRALLPDNLIFQLRYLGGVEESYTLNFSRPGHPIILQYYNLIHLGREGYARLHGNSLKNARLLSAFLEETGYFECISSIHRPKGIMHYAPGHKAETQKDHSYYNAGLPVVAFQFSKEFKEAYPEIPQATLAALLRHRGFIVPNYPLSPNEEEIEILRVVVRINLTLDMLDKLMTDIVDCTELLVAAASAARSATDNEASRAVVHSALEALVSATPLLEEDEAPPEVEEDTGYRGTC